jgi:hypothetical protein
MGIAIISGLTFATFLTLVIVPVMYSLFDSLASRMGRIFRGEVEPVPATNAHYNGNGATEPVSTFEPEAL